MIFENFCDESDSNTEDPIISMIISSVLQMFGYWIHSSKLKTRLFLVTRLLFNNELCQISPIDTQNQGSLDGSSLD